MPFLFSAVYFSRGTLPTKKQVRKDIAGWDLVYDGCVPFDLELSVALYSNLPGKA